MLNNKEAEQAVLSCCLLSEEAVPESLSMLSPKDFSFESHCIIFSAIEKLFNSRSSIDLVTVVTKLQADNQLDVCGGAAYLANISSFPSSARNISDYCKIVKDCSNSRQLKNICQQTLKDIEIGTDFDTASNSLGSSFIEITGKNEKSNASAPDLIDSIVDGIEERSKSKISLLGIPTGFADIDRRLHGLCKQDLIILAARPSMGKTTLALNMIENGALNGFKWGILSLEMGKGQLVLKTLSKLSRVDFGRLRTGHVVKDEWFNIKNAKDIIKTMPIFIDDQGGINLTQLRSKVMMMKIRHDIDGLMIDYLQLIRGGKKENRTQELTEITGTLKAIAKEFDIPVLALSQLNRNLESRTDKRPMMSDLRESGSIEQDADVIAFIYRDEVYNKAEDNPMRGVAEVNFAKIRLGEPGVCKLASRLEYSCFENLEG